MRELDCKFDVILVEPPLEEYQRTQGASSERYWSWDEIESLEIEQVAAQRSFLWIWCGSSDGLDAGRRVSTYLRVGGDWLLHLLQQL